MPAKAKKVAQESSRVRRERLASERLAALKAAQHRRWWRIGLGIAVVVVIVAGVAITWAVQHAKVTATPTSSASARDSAVPQKLEPGKPLVYGNPSAATTIEIWENPRCSHCVKFQERYGGQLNDAVQQGKIQLHIYALAVGDQVSERAVNALGCAAEAGYGLQFWDGIFQNPHADWTNDQVAQLFRAVSGKAEARSFATCVDARNYDRWVKSMAQAVKDNHIQYTPTLKRNGQEIDISKLTPETFAEILT